MSGLQRFEHRLSGLVEGGFARIFRGKVEPVELAAALAREADTNKAVGPQRVLVPNVYEIDLGHNDFERLAPYSLTLADELASILREHAAEQGYTFVGPVTVALRQLPNLGTGSFRIESRVEAGEDDGPPPAVRPFAPSPSVAAPPVPSTEPPLLASTTVLPPPSEPVAPPKPAVYGHLVLPDGSRHAVGEKALVLGRGQDADIRLSDSSVSRRHARISVVGGNILVEDLGSTNGTTVNGKKIDRETLKIGDSLGCGTAVVQLRG